MLKTISVLRLIRLKKSSKFELFVKKLKQNPDFFYIFRKFHAPFKFFISLLHMVSRGDQEIISGRGGKKIFVTKGKQN